MHQSTTTDVVVVGGSFPQQKEYKWVGRKTAPIMGPRPDAHLKMRALLLNSLPENFTIAFRITSVPDRLPAAKVGTVAALLPITIPHMCKPLPPVHPDEVGVADRLRVHLLGHPNNII